MPVTSFEDLEKQWKAAEQLEMELRPLFLAKAKELGVAIIMQVHDTIKLVGPLEQQSKLLAWMKEKIEEKELKNKRDLYANFLNKATSPEDRAHRKVIAFSFLYGTSPSTITKYTGLTTKKTKKLLEEFSRIFKGSGR
jgi:hypothetical protein